MLLLFTGFNISGMTPKIGILQNSAWNLTDICRFKILTVPISNSQSAENYRSSGPTTASTTPPGSSPTVKNKENTDRLDMPPPPSPASSTCSDTGSTSHSQFCNRIESDGRLFEVYTYYCVLYDFRTQ